MSEYKDPENVQDIIEDLKNAPTAKELLQILEDTCPNWISGVYDSYCDNFPQLQKNWLFICDKCGVSPKKIILVKDINFDEEHILIRTFCEIMTNLGFCVRRDCEFVPCNRLCGRVIPSQMMSQYLKRDITESNFCKKCAEKFDRIEP